MLKLENITVSFGNKKVLNNLSCEIETGDFIVIVGANGAGKSTLFDILAGRLQPTSGTILFNNMDITNLDDQQRATFISRLFQNPQANGVSSMTVAQNLSLAQYKGKNATFACGLKPITPEIKQMFDQLHFDAETILNTPMGLLSGGQRQCIAFMMATIIPPKILLLDEPTAALDPKAAEIVLHFASEYIKKHAITTLLITHDQQIAQTFGNKRWVIENGTIAKHNNN